ncbi:hypothetical protein [Acidocella aminolytica]|uniref:hypothetical protein n=1 Tax=Acidocella aminolytica TaxID=33998 RepID=UPI001FD5AC0D|nr:hypothetical protein [Acidocella aminolytica]
MALIFATNSSTISLRLKVVTAMPSRFWKGSLPNSTTIMISPNGRKRQLRNGISKPFFPPAPESLT